MKRKISSRTAPAKTVSAARKSARPSPAEISTGPITALQSFVDDGWIAGAVTLVADKDRVLRLEAIGLADLASRKPMKTDALFWIASMTKPITAAAFMMLVDEGKVGLDDPVERYLPEFLDLWVAVEREKDRLLLRRPTHAITVREILSHASGMPFGSAMEHPTRDLLPLREAVGSYAMTPLQSQPGTQYSYSNAGINTAGRIIEVVTGMAYEDFLDQRLLRPLGMTETTFWPSAGLVRRLATSYKPNADKTGLEETRFTQLHYPLSDRKRQPMPAGGLFSTAGDVARFCQMVLRGGAMGKRRYLSESAVAEMTRRQTGATLSESYGLGWSTEGGTFGHGGAYSTNMTIDLRLGLITVYLVQQAGYRKEGVNPRLSFVKAAEERFGAGR